MIFKYKVYRKLKSVFSTVILLTETNLQIAASVQIQIMNIDYCNSTSDVK